MVTNRETHNRERATLLTWLRWRGWTQATRALHFAEEYHCGLRKDGVTPEFSHQVHISLYLATLTPYFRQPEAVVVTALLHDVREDYDVTEAEIASMFGETVSRSVSAMTKKFRGERFTPEHVSSLQAHDEIASICKGADRIHNQATAVGVFSPEKIASYTAETRAYILPMLGAAQRRFPHQAMAYQNAMTVLISQVRSLDSLVAA